MRVVLRGVLGEVWGCRFDLVVRKASVVERRIGSGFVRGDHEARCDRDDFGVLPCIGSDRFVASMSWRRASVRVDEVL